MMHYQKDWNLGAESIYVYILREKLLQQLMLIYGSQTYLIKMLIYVSQTSLSHKNPVKWTFFWVVC